MNDQEFLEELKQVLDYNPATGVMTWKIDVANGKFRAGSLAGSVNKIDGRLRINFKGKIHLAHRLAWLLTHAKWPDGVIDHINGDPLNNCIKNLRDVSNTINQQNQREARSDNKTGMLGVSFCKRYDKFLAQIQLNGKKKHLGYFTKQEDARVAYLTAKREIHEGCTI